MPQFEVYVFCNECGQPHSAHIAMQLDLPVEKHSIGDLYAGQEVPPNLRMTNNYFQCPNTGKMFVQQDNRQVFLVPVAE